MTGEQSATGVAAPQEQTPTALAAALERHQRELDGTSADVVAHTDHSAFSSNPW